MLVILFASCNNDDDAPTDPINQLPPMAQTGESTFGFLLNGKAVAVTNSSQMAAIYQGGFIQFGAGGTFLIPEDPLVENNNYSLIGKARYGEDVEQGSCYYDFDNSYEGYVNFSKIKRDNFIVSGTFEFSTVTDNCETIRISNGRFDMKYIP